MRPQRDIISTNGVFKPVVLPDQHEAQHKNYHNKCNIETKLRAAVPIKTGAVSQPNVSKCDCFVMPDSGELKPIR